MSNRLSGAAIYLLVFFGFWNYNSFLSLFHFKFTPMKKSLFAKEKFAKIVYLFICKKFNFNRGKPLA